MGSEESTAATAVFKLVLDFKKVVVMGFGDFKKFLVVGSGNGLWDGELSKWGPKDPRFNVVEANMAGKNQLLLC